MKYEIIGNIVPAVEFTLNNGDSIYTQKGGMIWHSEGIDMSTNTKGGIRKGLGRVFSGDSFFMNTYTATCDGATIAFASTVPGKLVVLNFTSDHPGIIAQKGSFLCAQESINLNVAFTKKVGAGLFGGEGFVLQDISGYGLVVLEVDGDIKEKELKENESILIDTGNLVYFDKTCAYEVVNVKGVKNALFGGEGLFLTKVTGPGKVVLQTQNYYEYASKLVSIIPHK